MKGSWDKKKFLALFMAVAMVLASGIFVTTQSFKATDDDGYEQELAEQEVGDDADESDADFDDEDSDSEDFDEDEADEEIDIFDEEDAEDLDESEEADEEIEGETEAAETHAVKVKFDINGGEGTAPDDISVEAAEDGDIDADLPELDDYTDGNGAAHIFVGWSTQADATAEDDAIAADGEEVQLYAVWETEAADAQAEEAEPQDVATADAQPEEAEQPEEAPADEQVAETPAEEQAVEAPAEENNHETAETVDTEETEEEAVEEETAEETAEETLEEAAEENAEATENADQLTAEQLAQMPAESFEETTESGVTVYASYDAGVFPEGVTMKVSDVSKEEALDAVGDAVENATEAVGVDITFYDKDGNEIQPYNGGTVNVSLQLATPLFGETQTLVHVDSDGGASVISEADGSANSVSFEADRFSIYVLTGSGSSTDAEDREFDYKVAAKSETALYDDAHSGEGDDAVYYGGEWKIEEGADLISFADGEDTKPSEKKGAENYQTIKVVAGESAGSAVVTYTYKAGNESYTDKFNITIAGYKISFDLNGGTGTVPKDVLLAASDSDVYVQMPSGEGITREGYQFMGWTDDPERFATGIGSHDKWNNQTYSYYQPDDGNPATTDDMMNISKESGKSEYTIYAVWSKTGEVAGTITVAIRNDGTLMTEPVTYGQEYQFLTGTHNKANHNYWKDTEKADEKIEWYSDFDACTGNLGYYINYLDTNANLSKVTKQQLTANVQQRANEVNAASGYKFWNPEKEYIVWYVVKNESENHNWPQFHIDGCIRSYDKYYLNYDPNSNDYTGKAPASQEAIKKNGEDAIGEKVVVQVSDFPGGSAPLARKGYTFAGWNTERDGSGTGYKAGMDIELLQQTTTLFAMWTPNSSTQYKVRCFDADNGDELISEKILSGITGGTAVATDEDKTLDGYEFDESNSKNILQGTIDADGKLVLKLYFHRTGAVVLTANNLTKVYDGNEVAGEITGVTVNGTGATYKIDGGKITFAYNGKNYTVEGASVAVRQDGRDAAAKEVGGYDVVISADSAVVKSAKGKDTKMTVTAVDGRIDITKRPVAVTSATHEWEYDGKDHSDDGLTSSTGENEGWLAGDEPKWKVTGVVRTPTPPEGVKNTFETQLPNALEKLQKNYDITLVEGTLTVTSKEIKYEIALQADSVERLYDGKTYTLPRNGFEVVGVDNTGEEGSTWQSIKDFFSRSESITFTIGDATYTMSGVYASGEGTDAGTYDTKVSGKLVITDDKRNDVSGEFSVKTADGKLTIKPRTVEVHAATLEKEYDGEALANPAGVLTIGADGEYVVTDGFIAGDGFVGDDGASYSFSGSQEVVGTTPNEVSVVLNDGVNEKNYTITTVPGQLTVRDKGADSRYKLTVVTNEGTFDYDGTAHEVKGFVNETDGRIAAEYNGKNYFVTGLEASASRTDAGTQDVSVSGDYKVLDAKDRDVTKQFTVEIERKHITVNKKQVTLQSASLEKPYDGTTLVNPDGNLETAAEAPITIVANGKADGFVDGQGAVITFTGGQTVVGNSANSFTYELTGGAKADNYEIAVAFGQLTVVGRNAADNKITIVTKGGEFTYDGNEHTVNGFEDADDKGRIEVKDANGTTYYVVVDEMTAEVSGTDVTTGDGIPNVAHGTPKVVDEKGNDVTDQFAVSIETHNLVIHPRNITIVSADKSKVYDGEALTNGETPVTIEGDGLVTADKLAVTFTGSQTLVGQSENSFTYELEKADNYKVETKFGTLLVTTKGGNEPGGGDEPETPDEPKTVDPSKVIGKAHEDEGRIYKIGETVDFVITAKNIYDDARTLTIGEQEGVTLDRNVFENVAAGDTVTAMAHYTVTEADAVAGAFKNHATVTVSDGSNGQPGETWEATDDVIPEATKPSLTVHKTSDRQGTAVKIGETINYTVTVINNGNVEVKDITVTDELTGDKWTVPSLAAGATQDFEASHIVTKEDVAAGKVTNMAVAVGKDPKGNDVESRDGGSDDSKGDDGNNGGDNGGGDDGDSDTVTDEVDQKFNLTIHYVDENGNPIAPEYTKEYNYGEGYYVTSPTVSGYTPEYTFVSSDENGMPAQDVEVTVKYVKNPTATTTPTNPSNPDNSRPSVRGTDDDDDDDVADDDSGKSGKTTKNTNKKNNGGNDGNAAAGDNADNGAADDGNADTTGGNGATGTPRTITDRVEGGATVTIDEDGGANLVSASDTETPLFNLGLDGDHKCNVLRFLILLCAVVVVTVHTRKMRDYQSRLFELREKLEEEKDNR